jgi:predicted  nucleic acid-binding Zn-ribbon protein
MTMATDTDIREIKTAIEANTKTIATQSDRIEAIIRGTEANTKAISDLTQEMRLKFSSVENKIEVGFANVETKLTKLEGQILTLDAKFDERTKGIGQRVDGKDLAVRNVSTGLIVATTGGVLLAVAKYLFFGTLP